MRWVKVIRKICKAFPQWKNVNYLERHNGALIFQYTIWPYNSSRMPSPHHTTYRFRWFSTCPYTHSQPHIGAVHPAYIASRIFPVLCLIMNYEVLFFLQTHRPVPSSSQWLDYSTEACYPPEVRQMHITGSRETANQPTTTTNPRQSACHRANF